MLPTELEDACGDLHPIAFNSLWSLDQPDIHTLVIGAARPSDFDLAAEACQMLAAPESYQGKVAEIDGKLQAMAVEALGQEWVDSWWKGREHTRPFSTLVSSHSDAVMTSDDALFFAS